jgi:lipopolysaccharide transport system ATP-binding protein
VDEALAVGDAAFQAKCYARIREFRETGGSILLVTHAENVVTRFCDRAVLLEQGHMLMDDRPDKVVSAYMEMIYARKNGAPTRPRDGVSAPRASDEQSGIDFTSTEGRTACKTEVLRKLGLMPAVPQGLAKRIGNAEEAEILDLFILDEEGNKVTLLESGGRYRLAVVIIFYTFVTEYTLAFNIYDSYGTLVFGINTFPFDYAGLNFPQAYPGLVIRGSLDITMRLTNGTFFLSAAVSDAHNSNAKILDGWICWVPFSLRKSDKLLDASFVDLDANNFSAITL